MAERKRGEKDEKEEKQEKGGEKEEKYANIPEIFWIFPILFSHVNGKLPHHLCDTRNHGNILLECFLVRKIKSCIPVFLTETSDITL